MHSRGYSHRQSSTAARRRLFLCALALAAACHSRGISAQQSPRLTVEHVVAKLQANLDLYEKSIPSFLVDEHIDSFKHDYAARGTSAANYESIVESVFRLKRDLDSADNTVTLDESRDVSIIDGKPADGRDIDAPAMISGAFSGGLAFVSLEQQACMLYTLAAVKPHKPITVRFVSAPAAQRPNNCILAEDSSGRVTIDPSSMQITHIEVRVPRHLLIPVDSTGQKSLPTMTHWDIQVTYKPVVLNARTFWLPTTILSLCSNNQTEWSFKGTYRNYHLLEVHSRIIIPGKHE